MLFFEEYYLSILAKNYSFRLGVTPCFRCFVRLDLDVFLSNTEFSFKRYLFPAWYIFYRLLCFREWCFSLKICRFLFHWFSQVHYQCKKITIKGLGFTSITPELRVLLGMGSFFNCCKYEEIQI